MSSKCAIEYLGFSFRVETEHCQLSVESRRGFSSDTKCRPSWLRETFDINVITICQLNMDNIIPTDTLRGKDMNLIGSQYTLVIVNIELIVGKWISE